MWTCGFAPALANVSDAVDLLNKKEPTYRAGSFLLPCKVLMSGQCNLMSLSED
jgi:hypothetical protein